MTDLTQETWAKFVSQKSYGSGHLRVWLAQLIKKLNSDDLECLAETRNLDTTDRVKEISPTIIKSMVSDFVGKLGDELTPMLKDDEEYKKLKGYDKKYKYRMTRYNTMIEESGDKRYW